MGHELMDSSSKVLMPSVLDWPNAMTLLQVGIPCIQGIRECQGQWERMQHVSRDADRMLLQ